MVTKFPVSERRRKTQAGFLLAAGIGGLASGIGSIVGGSAAQNAASQETQAAQNALNNVVVPGTQAAQSANTNISQGQQFANDTNTNAANSSYNISQAVGQNAQTQLGNLLAQPNEGFQFNVQNDPGYAFNLQQGQQALQKAAAATGQSDSGATLKALTQYSQNYASNQYQNAFSNYQTQLNNLFNQTNVGLAANNAVSSNTNALNSVNTGLAQTQDTTNAGLQTNENQTAASLLTGIGNAQAQGTIGTANAINSGLSGISNAANQAFLYNLLSNGNTSGINALVPTLATSSAPANVLGT
jgi:hypothetical protein